MRRQAYHKAAQATTPQAKAYDWNDKPANYSAYKALGIR